MQVYCQEYAVAAVKATALLLIAQLEVPVVTKTCVVVKRAAVIALAGVIVQDGGARDQDLPKVIVAITEDVAGVVPVVIFNLPDISSEVLPILIVGDVPAPVPAAIVEVVLDIPEIWLTISALLDINTAVSHPTAPDLL